MTKREKYCRKLLHRLVDACRDKSFPRESREERSNVHTNTDGLVRLKGGYGAFLMEHGEIWANGLNIDFSSPEHLDLILATRGILG